VQVANPNPESPTITIAETKQAASSSFLPIVGFLNPQR
jgi:hypothetical protein